MKIPWHRLIAVWEIIGGIAGAAMHLSPMIHTLPKTRITEWPFVDLLFIALYTLGAISGLLLWNRGASGITLSKLIQLLQIPDIVAKGIAYRLVMILSIPVGLEVNQPQSILRYGIDWGFRFTLEQYAPKEFLLLQINLIALVIFILLFFIPVKKIPYTEKIEKRGELLFSE